MGNFLNRFRNFLSGNFPVVAIFSFLIFFSFSSIPGVASFLLNRVSGKYLDTIWFLYPFTTGIGMGKAFTSIAVATFSILCTLWSLFLSFKHKSKITLNLLTFLTLIPFYGLSFILFFGNSRSLNFNNLKIKNYPVVNYEVIFSKQKLPVAKIQNEDEFYKYVSHLYSLNKAFLMDSLKVENEDELKSIFFMNIVSRLWAYGNPDGKIPGCVLNNPQVGEIPESESSIQTYLSSPIACCTDYSKLLNSLLDKAGIRNRVVEIPGIHIFNEAFFSDSWHVLDATTNLLFQGTWKEITFRDPDAPVTLSRFPHHNTVKSHPTDYREIMGSFRYEMISAALRRRWRPVYKDELARASILDKTI